MTACLAALIAMIGLPALAQEPMDAAEFDAYATGRTITFRTELNPTYGVERYLPGRRVMWSAFDGTCRYGVWFESKGDICFRYDHDPEHKCWTIYLDPEGLRGIYTTRAPHTVIFEVPDRTDPLICNDLSS
ncbi:hypothetical protein SLH49_07100 [Cognatiyoonia sp. IB215446]|uniref:hypothetical protein n=1 Tax=Cognatiyoonia sp. IB215446 TaxID=3097355 RepID=UPI002A0E199C|nr:hypothetical protein [Cognatiyoonia sp. IB215446]MDX8347749.1 hypothetical protein [Cognatiyoonia sp. IB215446]